MIHILKKFRNFLLKFINHEIFRITNAFSILKTHTLKIMMHIKKVFLLQCKSFQIVSNIGSINKLFPNKVLQYDSRSGSRNFIALQSFLCYIKMWHRISISNDCHHKYETLLYWVKRNTRHFYDFFVTVKCNNMTTFIKLTICIGMT